MLASHIPNKRWQTCLVENDDQLCWMARQADAKFWTFNDSEEAIFVCAYTDLKNYPFPRWYLITVKADLHTLSEKIQVLIDRGFNFKFIDPERARNLYGCEGELNSVAENYLEKKANSIAPHLRRMLEGRRLFTELEHCFIISTPECLTCGEKNAEPCTSTIQAGKVSCIVFSLCKSCFEKDIKNGEVPLFEWVFRKLGSSSLGFFVPCTEDEMIPEIETLLKNQLDCYDILYVKERKTMKARRKSGFELIFRLNSVDDYAYLIKDSLGKEVARFDCADHHVMEGGPHHVHFDTRTKRSAKIVSPSYFVGSPLFDLKGFKALLEGKEAESVQTKGESET